jgi:hypothetical protein
MTQEQQENTAKDHEKPDLDDIATNSSGTKCNTSVSNVALDDSQIAQKVVMTTENPQESNDLDERKELTSDATSPYLELTSEGTFSDNRCEAILPNGNRCTAPKVRGSKHCFFQ